MKFERKYYIYILIALVISLTAIAQEQTISSELANFTEINTSRIFRVYDASTSEILLSSDALYLNHVNGGINEVKITSTDTQFMNDIDMAGNDINNCGNCGGSDNLSWQNSKVNKSGDNMTGRLNINSNFSINRSINWADANKVATGAVEIYNNGTLITNLRDNGAQFWFLHYSANNTPYVIGDFAGSIGYSYPLGGIGFSMRNSSAGRNQTIWNTGWQQNIYFKPSDDGKEYILCLAPGNTSGSPSCKLEIYSNGSIRNPNLTGTGYGFQCVNSQGFEIRSSIACDLI